MLTLNDEDIEQALHGNIFSKKLLANEKVISSNYTERTVEKMPKPVVLNDTPVSLFQLCYQNNKVLSTEVSMSQLDDVSLEDLTKYLN